jgi:hypothetical protein
LFEQGKLLITLFFYLKHGELLITTESLVLIRRQIKRENLVEIFVVVVF